MTLDTFKITPENISGLVVGEGCFYCESAPDPKYKLGWRIRPAFCIEMRADDKGVLAAVQQHLRCGRIYELDFGRYKGYENRGWLPHAKYRVTRLKDLENRVVPFFASHPLFGRKALAYSMFAEIVQLLASGHHRTPSGLAAVQSLASALSAHNSRGEGGSNERPSR